MKTERIKMSVTHADKTFGSGGKLEFEVEAPMAESLEEAVNWAGGNELARDVLNWAAQTRAKTRVRSLAGNQEAEENSSLESFLSAVSEIFENTKPTAGRVGLSVKDKASNFDTYKQKLAEMLAGRSEDEISGADMLEIAKELGMLP